MSRLRGLLRVGTLTDSVNIYVPAVALRQAIGLIRVLLFIHLVSEVQYGLWGLGAMIFFIGSTVMTLGSNEGLVRYVSRHQARRTLSHFYRRVLLLAPLATVATAALAFALHESITKAVIVSRAQEQISFEYQRMVCLAALANAFVLAIYHNVQGFLLGLRAYRMVSVLEMAFAVLFTAAGVLAACVWGDGQSALALLLAHLVSLLAPLAMGTWAVHYAVGHASQRTREVESTPVLLEPETELIDPDGTVAAEMKSSHRPVAEPSAISAVFRFGVISMAAHLTWMGARFVGLFLINKEFGKVQGANFFAYLLIANLIVVLANAARAVIFTYVAQRWEDDRRQKAMETLQTTYKAVALATMSLAAIVYVSAPLWTLALPQAYRAGRELLGGLLTFYQVGVSLALLNIIARLRERPSIVILPPAIGIVLNVLLALWWMPDQGAAGAARAVGAGIYVAAGAVMFAYFIAARIRMHASSYVIFLAPVIFLLHPWVSAAMWAVMICIAAGTRWLFSTREKRLLLAAAGRFISRQKSNKA